MTRVLTFAVVGLLLMTVLGPLQRYLALEMVVVDVPLITVLYMVMAGRGVGLPRKPKPSILAPSGGIDWTGGLTGFLLGYMADLLGGGPKGIHCLSMGLIFLFGLWAARHVYLAGTFSVVLITVVASLLTSLIGLTIHWAMGTAPSLATLAVIGLQAVLCGIVAPLLMRLFRFVDAKLAGADSDRGTLCP
jgi:hypothetical protein